MLTHQSRDALKISATMYPITSKIDRVCKCSCNSASFTLARPITPTLPTSCTVENMISKEGMSERRQGKPSLECQPLTETALAHHDAQHATMRKDEAGLVSSRVRALQRAAQDLGFDLPAVNFKPYEHRLPGWIDDKCLWGTNCGATSSPPITPQL